MTTVRIADITNQIRGVSYKPSDVKDGQINGAKPILRANNITPDGLVFEDLVWIDEKVISKKQLLQKFDILIAASSGSKSVIGKASQLSRSWDGSFGAFCKVLRPKIEKVDPKYLYYFFQTKEYRTTVSALSAGANINNLRNEHLDNLQIPLPPLPIQKKIAAILDKADRLFQKDKQLLEHYNKLAQSIFYDMFGDPLRNEKGWDKPPFGSIGESRLGKMLDSKKQNGGAKYPYLGNSNVKWGLIDFNNLKEMEFTDDERIEFQLKDGDLLICEGGEVGRCAIWKNEQSNVYFQKAIHRVRLKSERALPEYIQFVFQHYGQHNGFKDFVTVATIAHLTGIKLRQVPVPIPPIELQRKFSTLLQNVLQQRKMTEENLIKTESLFQNLLQKAFKGELVEGS